MLNLPMLKNNPYYAVEITALISGVLLPFSFAPYNLFWLQFPLLAYLFLICLEQVPRVAFRRGLVFGLGWFAHGIHWMFYSLYFHGGAPVFLAVIMVLLMSLVLSLFPATAFYLANRFIRSSKVIMLALVYPLVLIVFEWLRGYVLTGLPWVQIGIAHVDTYLGGYGPIIGGLGMGLMACFVAGLFAVIMLKQHLTFAISAIVSIYLAGFLLSLAEWTQPINGPVKVSMIQGNIPQTEKWKRENKHPTLSMYRELTRNNWQSDLIIWPETAVPDFYSRVPAYLKQLEAEAEKNNTDVLFGVFVRDQQTQRYYNSVATLDGQVYKKRHLVPLGEYFPFRSLMIFFAQWINIPMSDIDSGDAHQPLIKAAGQSLGVSICFEDAFDRDVLLDVPEATLLVNVSNDAWFEDSPQPWQHHQMARVRALETGRVLLRSTNTGVSSVIGVNGEVLAISPQFKRHVLTASVQGYQGATPYALWANYLLIICSLIVLAVVYKKYNSQSVAN